MKIADNHVLVKLGFGQYLVVYLILFKGGCQIELGPPWTGPVLDFARSLLNKQPLSYRVYKDSVMKTIILTTCFIEQTADAWFLVDFSGSKF